MLKGAIVGGPSLVFTRKHVVDETSIRSHCFPNSKPVKAILGYDANSLYPSTMLEDMPCGPGVVVTYPDPAEAAQDLPWKLKTGKWFSFAEVDIEVPAEQWHKFEDFPPLFINRAVPEAAIPDHMKQYLHNSGRSVIPDQRKLLGVMSASKILLYAPLLEWYVDMGLTLKAVYRTIDYKPAKIFSWFARTTAENVLAVANSAKDTASVLLGLGVLGLVLWALSWKALTTSSSQPEAAQSTSQQDGTREPPTVAKAPTTEKEGGIRNME